MHVNFGRPLSVRQLCQGKINRCQYNLIPRFKSSLQICSAYFSLFFCMWPTMVLEMLRSWVQISILATNQTLCNLHSANSFMCLYRCIRTFLNPLLNDLIYVNKCNYYSTVILKFTKAVSSIVAASIFLPDCSMVCLAASLPSFCSLSSLHLLSLFTEIFLRGPLQRLRPVLAGWLIWWYDSKKRALWSARGLWWPACCSRLLSQC